MKIDLQTIFYILAGIAYLYTRSKKNNKKPGGQQIPENDVPTSSFDWEKTLRDLMGGEEEPTAPAAEAPRAKPGTEPKVETVVETYEEKTRKRTQTRNYDDETLKKNVPRDYDVEVISRHSMRNYEDEALKRTETRNLEYSLKKERERLEGIPVIELHEELHIPAFELNLQGDELKKAVVYAEILAPRHF